VDKRDTKKMIGLQLKAEKNESKTFAEQDFKNGAKEIKKKRKLTGRISVAGFSKDSWLKTFWTV
jgi:hypothetical protein